MARFGVFTRVNAAPDPGPLPEEPAERGAQTLRSFKNAFQATMAEFLFVLFPLMVLAFVILTTRTRSHSLLATPEWSFGAAILFGQAVQKITAASARTQAYPWQKTTLLVSALLIFGLMPSLITLALLIYDAPPSVVVHDSTLTICQVALFVLGSLAFLFLGTVSHYLLFDKQTFEARS